MDPSSKKVEVTLKTAAENGVGKSSIVSFSDFHVGDVIHGRIRRTESYGLFITIDNSNMVKIVIIFFGCIDLKLYFNIHYYFLGWSVPYIGTF